MLYFSLMPEPQPKLKTAAEVFDSVSLPQPYRGLAIGAICEAQSLAELDPLRRHVMRASDLEQFLLPIFRPLYQRLEGFRERVLQYMGPQPLNAEEIDEYFTSLDDQPYILAGSKYKERGIREWGDAFGDKTREVMFISLKQTLCRS